MSFFNSNPWTPASGGGSSTSVIGLEDLEEMMESYITSSENIPMASHVSPGYVMIDNQTIKVDSNKKLYVDLNYLHENLDIEIFNILKSSENLIDPSKIINGFGLRYTYNTNNAYDYYEDVSQVTYEETFEAQRYDVIYSNSAGRLVWYSSSGLVNGNTSFVFDEELGLYKATISTTAVAFKLDAYLSEIALDGYWFVCKNTEYEGFKYPYETKKLNPSIKSNTFANKSEIKELSDEIKGLKGSTDLSFFLPSELYCYADNQNDKWINIDNVLVGNGVTSYYIKHTAGWYLQDYERLKTQSADQITVLDKLTNTVKFTTNYQRRSVEPSTKSNPLSKKNVLLIGDSLSDAGFIPCDIKRQITVEHGFDNFEFIGTKLDTINGITCLNEGRGGYSITDFTKNNNELGRGLSYPNPFLINGQVSMINYMSENSFTGNIDYCIIELGVNNIVGLGQEPLLVKAELKKLLNQIINDYPNCKIFVCGLLPISKINGEKSYIVHNTHVMSINKGYQDLCKETPYVNNCVYVDIGLFFDTYVGYPMINQPYRGSTMERLIVTDWLHPSEAGYYMISDTISSAFIYHI